jgi:hypothetical protein
MKPFVASICMFVLLCSPETLWAGTQDAELHVDQSLTGRLHVIAIGVNATEDKQIGDLRFAAKDAKLITGIFGKGGLPPEQIDLIIPAEGGNGADIPNRTNILERIRLRARMPCNTLVIFFSGHGTLLREEDGSYEWYLIPQNAAYGNLQTTAVSLREIRQILDSSKAERKLLLLDCCRTEEGKNVVPPADAQITARFKDARATEVLAACSPGQKSWEDAKLGLGFFTSAVGRGLLGEADVAPRDGIVDSAELAEYVVRTVATEAELDKKEQVPERQFTGTAPIPLIRVSSAPDFGTLLASFAPESDAAAMAAMVQPDIVAKPQANSPRLVYILLVSGILLGVLWKYWPVRRRGVTVSGGRQRHSVP